MSELPVLDGVALDRLRRIGGDALVSKMVTLFLNHGAEKIAAVIAAVEARDARALEQTTHSLKSSAGNLGGARVQHTAEILERLAGDGTIDAECVGRLVREFDEMADALRQTAEESA